MSLRPCTANKKMELLFLHFFESVILIFLQHQPPLGHICYSPEGRSELGKTVPKVLDTAKIHKTEGTVFPNSDRPWLVNNIFGIFLKPNKWLRKKPPAVSGPDGENTARSRNQLDFRSCKIPPAHELRKK